MPLVAIVAPVRLTELNAVPLPTVPPKVIVPVPAVMVRALAVALAIVELKETLLLVVARVVAAPKLTAPV